MRILKLRESFLRVANMVELLKTTESYSGSPIPSDMTENSQREAWKCDLMLICGTSAVVYLFASLSQPDGPGTIIIGINTDPTPLTERM